MAEIVLSAARDRNGVIGSDGGLPWRIPSDLAWFKASTLNKPVIMGRKTWDTLPKKPLIGRPNIVLTRTPDIEVPGGHVCLSIEEAIQCATYEAIKLRSDEIVVMGGAEVYRLFYPLASRIYLAEVEAEVVGDVTFPAVCPSDWRVALNQAVPMGPKDEYPVRRVIFERREQAKSISQAAA